MEAKTVVFEILENNFIRTKNLLVISVWRNVRIVNGRQLDATYGNHIGCLYLQNPILFN